VDGAGSTCPTCDINADALKEHPPGGIFHGTGHLRPRRCPVRQPGRRTRGLRRGQDCGHAAAGLSRSDLKDLGELLDEGQSGFVLVAASDVQAHLDRAIKHAKKTVKKEMQADTDSLKKDIDALGTEPATS
jgi:hypothetical protein